MIPPASKWIRILFFALGLIFWGNSCAKKEEPLPVHLNELSKTDAAQLENQRAFIADQLKQRYGIQKLFRAKEDLKGLQRLLNDRVFGAKQTYEIQSLAVAYGDLLASELSLRWVIETGEKGRSPALILKNSDIEIRPLEMISRPVAKGDPVDLSWLLNRIRRQLAQYAANGEQDWKAEEGPGS